MSQQKISNKFIPLVFILLLAGIGLFFALRSFPGKQGNKIDKTSADFSKGVTVKYNALNTTFSLTYPKHLQGLSRDSLPWGGQMDANSDKSGMIVAYVAKEKRPALKDPYIQIHYISRGLPEFSTKDSALSRIEKTIFLVQESKVLNSRQNVRTQSGREAITGVYLWGKRPVRESFIKEKYVAYAYLEHSDKLLLAFSLTTASKVELDNYLNDFYYILKSYKP